MNGVDYYRDRRVNRSQYNRLTVWGKFWGGVIGVRLSKLDERLRCRLRSHVINAGRRTPKTLFSENACQLSKPKVCVRIASLNSLS